VFQVRHCPGSSDIWQEGIGIDPEGLSQQEYLMEENFLPASLDVRDRGTSEADALG
jgi:hypothetical protein